MRIWIYEIGCARACAHASPVAVHECTMRDLQAAPPRGGERAVAANERRTTSRRTAAGTWRKRRDATDRAPRRRLAGRQCARAGPAWWAAYMYSYSYMWLLPLLLPSARADEDVPSRPLHCPSEKNGVGVSVLVETELGLINGTRCGRLDHFLGVYYAEPPLGPLRFRPAVPKKKWAPTVMDATWYAAAAFPLLPLYLAYTRPLRPRGAGTAPAATRAASHPARTPVRASSTGSRST